MYVSVKEFNDPFRLVAYFICWNLLTGYDIYRDAMRLGDCSYVSVENYLTKKYGQERVLSPPFNFFRHVIFPLTYLEFHLFRVSQHRLVKFRRNFHKVAAKASFMLSVSANLKQVRSKTEHGP